jgi:hypothetical protein
VGGGAQFLLLKMAENNWPENFIDAALARTGDYD